MAILVRERELREEVARLTRENRRLRAWVESKATYYTKDAAELKREAGRLTRSDAEAAMFRSGCADYAAAFAAELRALLAPAPATAQPAPDVQAALADALERALRVIEALMPGVRFISVQNYAELNEAPIAARAALLLAGRKP